MRWFAWLVALCLLAAGGARPHPTHTLDRHEATVEDASDLATLIPRRPSAFTPDKRADRGTDLAAVPVIATPPAITRALVASSVDRSTCAERPRSRAHSSRGPPATSLLASIHQRS